MESDPFAQAVEDPGAPADDPFADAAMEPEIGDDPAQEVAAEPTPAPDTAPPIVDREGNPVEPGTPGPPEPTPVPEPTPDPVGPPEPEQPPAAAETPQGGQPTQEDQNTGNAPTSPQQEEQAGKSPMRQYKILYQTADNQWTEVVLDAAKAPEGVSVVEVPDVPGEKWVEARNNDHALRLGFVLLNRPSNGVTIFPVPRGAYKPKRVKPATPKPERERLEIG
jgi:hypothetical protein